MLPLSKLPCCFHPCHLCVPVCLIILIYIYEMPFLTSHSALQLFTTFPTNTKYTSATDTLNQGYVTCSYHACTHTNNPPPPAPIPPPHHTTHQCHVEKAYYTPISCGRQKAGQIIFVVVMITTIPWGGT